MTVIITHGFNSQKHAVWLGELGRCIEADGYATVSANYGHVWLFGVASATDDLAREIASMALPGDVAVGHSNGCTGIHKAMIDYGANIERAFFINPSLPRDPVLPPWLRHVDVFYAPNEIATLAGTLWAWANPMNLIGASNNWGPMGRWGYSGDDERVTNINLGQVGHSGALEFNRRQRLADVIVDRIEGGPKPDEPIFRS